MEIIRIWDDVDGSAGSIPKNVGIRIDWESILYSLDVAMAECRPLVSHNVTNSAPIDRSARRAVIDSEYFRVPFRAFSRRSVDLDILVVGLVNVVLVN